jgi:hypothetical protein
MPLGSEPLLLILGLPVAVLTATIAGGLLGRLVRTRIDGRQGSPATDAIPGPPTPQPGAPSREPGATVRPRRLRHRRLALLVTGLAALLAVVGVAGAGVLSGGPRGSVLEAVGAPDPAAGGGLTAPLAVAGAGSSPAPGDSGAPASPAPGPESGATTTTTTTPVAGTGPGLDGTGAPVATGRPGGGTGGTNGGSGGSAGSGDGRDPAIATPAPGTPRPTAPAATATPSPTDRATPQPTDAPSTPSPTTAPTTAPTPDPTPPPTAEPTPAPTATPKPPIAAFSVSVDGLTVSIANRSKGGVAWSWTFGDGGASALRNPSHAYAEAGTYTITLVATSSAGGTDRATETVTVGG